MADWKNLGADRSYNEKIPNHGRVLAGVASKVSECFLCGPAVSKIATATRLYPQMVGCNSRRQHVVRGMDDVERGQGPTVADPAFCAEGSLSEKEVVVAHAHEFESFFRAHHGGLIAFLRKRTVSYDDAEEAAQESCARLLAYGSIASRPENVWKALLYQIASNLAVDEYRKSQREFVQVDASASEESLPTPSYAPHDLAIAEEELLTVRSVLLGLPLQTRRIFLLSRAHHKSYREIATVCRVSVKTVEKHISRALRKLREAVQVDYE